MLYYRQFLKCAAIDRAVGYAIFSKAWLFLAGPITLYLIFVYLTPEVQGFYYTFLSLIALQVFMELGFYVVITQFASHEWSNLQFDNSGFIIGEPTSLSRLVSLGRLVFKWYGVATGLFVVLVGIAGYNFLSNKANGVIEWQAPWFVLIIVSSLQLWMLPFLSLLEGCNQVANIYKFRLVQGVVSSFLMWATLIFGGELWVVVVSVGTGVVTNILFFTFKYPNFFKTLYVCNPTTKISWRSEIWPMQWRLAIGGIVGYLMFSLYVPIMYQYHGPVVAGQMGMTWQIIGALGALAMAWINTQVPTWGILIAKKEYADLDHRFFRASGISILVITLCAMAVWLVVYGINYFQYPLSQRMLAPLPTAIFLIGAISLQVTQCFSSYLRAHKKDPLMHVGVVVGLTTGLLVWILGGEFGPLGASVSFFVVIFASLFFSYRIWQRCRHEWH